MGTGTYLSYGTLAEVLSWPASQQPLTTNHVQNSECGLWLQEEVSKLDLPIISASRHAYRQLVCRSFQDMYTQHRRLPRSSPLSILGGSKSGQTIVPLHGANQILLATACLLRPASRPLVWPHFPLCHHRASCSISRTTRSQQLQ